MDIDALISDVSSSLNKTPAPAHSADAVNPKYGSVAVRPVKPNSSEPAIPKYATLRDDPEVQALMPTNSNVRDVDPEDMPSYEDFMESFAESDAKPQGVLDPKAEKLRKPVMVRRSIVSIDDLVGKS